MKILWLDRLISMLDTQLGYRRVIPASRFPPFPCRSQEVATSSLFSVVVPGPNAGAQPSLSEILHLESDVFCHSQDNHFH